MIFMIKRMVCYLAVAIFIFFPLTAATAIDRLTFGVTPPFFEVLLERGKTWNGSVKVINGNSRDLAFYPSVMNFLAVGEDGQGRIEPITADPSSALASWIVVMPDPVSVPAQKSVDIPFLIRTPADAPPGGYYAAILIGTAPPDGGQSGESVMRVSSAISSLIFARVQGETEEAGHIREFYSAQSLVQKPEVSFVLRFENTGNVHLQPRGEITVYNMWGNVSGKIPVNQDSEYGNVMPRSVRKFSFVWKGGGGIFDIGRNKAVATLTFGSSGRQNVVGVLNFWVIPFRPILISLFFLAFLIFFFFLSIKIYVKKIVARGDRAEKIIAVRDTKRVWKKSKCVSIIRDIRFLVSALIGYIVIAAYICWRLFR